MSRKQYSEEQNYSVPPYREPKMKLLAFIIATFHLIFVCIPVFLLVYVSVDVAFFFRDSITYIKKTIKNAKAKLVSKLA